MCSLKPSLLNLLTDRWEPAFPLPEVTARLGNLNTVHLKFKKAASDEKDPGMPADKGLIKG